MIDLETSRLRFRQWRESDIPAITDFFGDPEKVKFVGGQKTAEECWRLMATYIGHYQLKGYGYLAVEEKSTHQLIGSVGLWDTPSWPELEMGYWLLQTAQGNGYATEAGQAVLNYVFDTLKRSTLVSYIAPDNIPSQRLSERLGAKRENLIELLTYGQHYVYRYHRKV